MELGEIRDEKQRLTDDIKKLMEVFVAKTGLRIESVNGWCYEGTTAEIEIELEHL